MFLKDALTLWVDPAKTHYRIGGSRPESQRVKKNFSQRLSNNYFSNVALHQTLRVTNALESLVIDPAYYQVPSKIEHHKKYIRVRNMIKHRDDYRGSEWYSDLVSDLNEHGFAKHKKILMPSISDIDNFMESYVLSLFDSLERDGFDFTKSGGIGRVLIGADGSIHKSASGNHRFYAARELGLSPIPVRIAGVHEDWYRKHIGDGFSPRKLKMALSEIQAKHA